MNTDLHFSSKSDNWETPKELFDELNREFSFNIDVCATHENAKCRQYYTVETDSLARHWHLYGPCWMNPPYGRDIAKWIEKASKEAQKGATVVCLLPARTDTKAFHKYIWDLYEHKPRPGVEVRFLKGRLKFVGAEHSAPFPSMIVIFRGSDREM